jgi:cytochrome c
MRGIRNAAVCGLVVALAAITGTAVAADAVDDGAAKALLKKSDCGKCHSVDKKKDGPSFKETAAKYKGKAEGENDVFKHVTTGPMVKVEGKEEEHRKVKSSDEGEIRNLVRWILTR